jgi:hypothetical protein
MLVLCFGRPPCWLAGAMSYKNLLSHTDPRWWLPSHEKEGSCHQACSLPCPPASRQHRATRKDLPAAMIDHWNHARPRRSCHALNSGLSGPNTSSHALLPLPCRVPHIQTRPLPRPPNATCTFSTVSARPDMPWVMAASITVSRASLYSCRGKGSVTRHASCMWRCDAWLVHYLLQVGRHSAASTAHSFLHSLSTLMPCYTRHCCQLRRSLLLCCVSLTPLTLFATCVSHSLTPSHSSLPQSP